MSSSSHKLGRWLVASVALVGAAAAHSQENYLIPQVSLGADYNTNRDLNPTTSVGTETYRAAAEARIGRATPRSETEIHPKLVYQYFEGDTQLNKLDEFLDMRSRMRTLTGRFDFSGQYARQDIVSAELGTAVFNDFNNGAPADETALVNVHGTRQTVDVKPQYSLDLNDRSSLSAGVEYHAVKYDATLFDKVGYKAPYAEFTYDRVLGPRDSISVGPYYSRYEADDNSNKTNTYGAIGEYRHSLSEVTSYSVALRVEEDKSTQYLAGAPIDSASKATWGLEFVGFRRFFVGRLRYSIGRFLQPSTLGNRRETDQIQLQYDRPINLRLSVSGAVRLAKDTGISGDISGSNDRTRGFADLSVDWQWTRTIYLDAGYHYSYQKLSSPPTSAFNNAVSLSIVYRGMQPRLVERMR